MTPNGKTLSSKDQIEKRVLNNQRKKSLKTKGTDMKELEELRVLIKAFLEKNGFSAKQHLAHYSTLAELINNVAPCNPRMSESFLMRIATEQYESHRISIGRIDSINKALRNNNEDSCIDLPVDSVRAQINNQSLEPLSAIEVENIKTLIQNAAKAEFEAYKAIPEIRMDTIERYCIKGGQFYYFILDYLIQRKDLNLTLNHDNWSSYNVRNIIIEERGIDYVIVKTTESWRLNWYDNNNEMYTPKYIYNHINKQSYTLKRIMNEWKIESNVCPGSQYFS